MRSVPLLLGALLLTGCSTTTPHQISVPTPTSTATPSATPAPPPHRLQVAAAPTRTPLARPTPIRVVEVRYRIERHVADAPEFVAVVNSTLHDRRGWQRAAFRLDEDPRAAYVVLLVEPDQAQRLCAPYDVYRKYSCQNGRRVVLNAERWRHATPEWTGSIAGYRQMLVNHEFGHLLGQHHPSVQCPRVHRPAGIMAQQSTALNGCLPNPWPLRAEVDHAAQHREPLAPPADT